MMTPRTKQTLHFIEHYVEREGFSPTIAEIAQYLKLQSTGTAYRYVKSLSDMGYIKRLPGKRRNIQCVTREATDESKTNFCLPLLGKIAAGRPIEALSGIETVDLAQALLGDDRYLLKVSGDSMIEEGIFDGDLVVCTHTQTANNGDIVVALIDDEAATLKRYFHPTPSTIVLQPANASHSAMEFEASRVKIQGIMIGLLRIAA